MLANMRDGFLFSRSKKSRPVIFSEALEGRCLLSVAPGLAPRTIAGATIDAAITAGLAPLDVSGSYTFEGAADTTYNIVNAQGGATDGSGNYSYSRPAGFNGDTGIIRYTDSITGVTYVDVLTFLTVGAGNYVISPATPGGSGSQSGSFALTAGPRPTTSDPAVNVLSVPSGSFVGGEQGMVIVEIANAGAGTKIANAFVTLNLYLSPDGNVADATPVTNVNRKITLGTPGNTTFPIVADFSIPFTYPSNITGNFFWVVKLSPSLGLDDADQSNDLANSAATVNVSPPFIDLAETDITVKDLGADGIVTATKQQAIVTLLNDGNKTIAGTVHFSVYMTPTVGGTDTPMVPKPIPVSINLRPGKVINVALKFIGPNETIVDEEFILATVSTVGVVTESGTVNGVDANNTVITTAPVLFTPPAVTLVDAISGSLPASVVGGSAGSTNLQVFNDGNIPFNALVTVTLYVSADQTLDSGDTQVLFGGTNKSIAVGKSVQFPLKFTYPANLANGDYYLLAQVSSTTTPVAGSMPPISVSAPASNVAISATQVNISQPIVTIAANFGTLPGTAFAEGQTVTLPLDLLNSGNVTAKGNYTVQLLASTTGDPADPTAIPLATAFTRSLDIKANVVSKTTIKLVIPSGVLTSGVTYFFVARIDASAIPDITDPNPTAAASQGFTVS
jgi:hypothetical protein